MSSIRALFLPALLAAPLTVAPAQAHGLDGATSSRVSATTGSAPLLAAAGTTPAAREPQVVNITVTRDGFVPAEVTVKRGRPVKLVVTRKVERTCATEIVMKDFGVARQLPLDRPVTVTVTPAKPRAYRFACGMDMIAGVLKVQ